jgi:hypothetical protein
VNVWLNSLQKVSQKFKYWSKNAEFDADFESVQEVAKKFT